ncbi:DUF4381 family protein [Methylobacterium sp. NEAU 140]|uniref:DUF4381 family protein n=1 Tax=Methylobacterium sp. NEAU 140 TaxID=3064945 RepID=UPI002732509C|nr:DUF4381 family protein [Methylobacterium sp. NEAU 140]MDP4022689.1 DUF4381 family protein [Methylobacterium sp. NEAU 140]
MTPADAPLTLDALRGLHLPGGAAGAVQGEILAAAALGFLAALLVGALRVLRVRARATVRRAALAELAGSRGLDPDARLVAQARLLRRLVRTVSGDADAAVQGGDWARRLDALFRTDFFTAGAGRVLADGLYRRQTPDLDRLDAELGRLIGRLRA